MQRNAPPAKPTSPSRSTFQMPAYTSHTARPSTAVKRSTASQQHQAPHHSDSDHNLLAMLTSTVACLKDKHMDMEALSCLEQSLWLKRRMFGSASSAVHKSLHEVILSYNSIAMQFLSQGQFDQCLSLLRKADAITSPTSSNFPNCESLQILTFNNIGCCYRKLGKLKSALKYLQEASRIGASCAKVKNLSITYLNLCAIQSQLGRHDLALEHAQAAIFHTQEELVGLENSNTGSSSTTMNTTTSGDESHGQGEEDVLDAKSKEEKIVSLAVAYHNLAVELEFNGRGEASVQWYKKALQLMAKYQRGNESLYASFHQIFTDAKSKYDAQKPQQQQFQYQSQKEKSGRAAAAVRPQSASSARRAAPHSSHNPQLQKDLSYSATVASQCYKPIKPSTAGLQYTKPMGRSPPKQKHKPVVTHRPMSATSGRRRPLSASRQEASGSSSQRARKERGYDDSSGGGDGGGHQEADMIEKRWQQIEKELFGGSGAATATTASSSSNSSERARGRVVRPQSAKPLRSGHHGQQQPIVATARRPQREQEHYGDEDEEDEDDACGIIQDDDDDDDDDDEEAHEPVQSHQQSQRRPIDAVSTRTPRSGSTSARHRQALQESRNSKRAAVSVEQLGHESRRRRRRKGEEDDECSSGESGVAEDQEEDDQGSLCGSGGGGDEDGSSLSGELPRHRVSHLEYLRKMKKLAENIHDDLDPTGSITTTVTTTGATPSGARRVGPPPPQRKGEPFASCSKANEEGEDGESTTPRSSSKLRERLELVRRESAKSLEPKQSDGEDQASSTRSLPPPLAVVICEEDVHTEDPLVVERRLLDGASARRIQFTLRGHAAHCQVDRLLHTRKQNAAARLIQKQSKQFVQNTQRKRREFTCQNDAATRIQKTYRRKYCGAQQADVQDDQEDLEEDGQEDGQEEEEEQEEEEQEEEEEQPAYTPLPSARGACESAKTTPRPDALSSSTSSSSSSSPSPSLPPAKSTVVSPSTTPRAVASVASAAVASSPRVASAPASPIASPRPAAAATPITTENDVANAAARCIQWAFRAYCLSCGIAFKKHARRLSRSYIERHHYHVVLTHAQSQEQSFLENLCATKIQALVRGQQTRFVTDATKIGRHAAAASIQNRYRRHHEQTKHSIAKGIKSIAACTIQRCFREVAARRARNQQQEMDHDASLVHSLAAQTIQNGWKQFVVTRNLKIEAWEAATCIQALGRGHLSRKALHASSSASMASAFSIDTANTTSTTNGSGGATGASDSAASALKEPTEEEEAEVDAYDEEFDEEQEG